MRPTTEREITRAVRLCSDEGRYLDPDAVGFSRTPLHDCNLRGVWGRTKRWDYWAVISDDFAFSLVYADVDYIGIVATWWADLRSGESGGRESVLPLARGVDLPDLPGSAPLTHQGRNIGVEVSEGSAGTMLVANWTEPDGSLASASVVVALPEGHESLNVVIPWSRRRFQYTSKHQARPATGSVSVGDRTWELGGGARDAWGVLDVGRGRWPYSTRWNWGGGAGTSADGSVVGLQFGGKWTEGTGFTENGLIVDGRLTKIGEELEWSYDWDDPLAPWRVRHPDGTLDVELDPVHDRHSRVEALVMGTEVHQVFGTWSGELTTDDGRSLSVEGIPGFAEESRSRW